MTSPTGPGPDAGAAALAGLRMLVVDDERPALDELVYLLGRDPQVATLLPCSSAAEATRLLRETDVDCVVLDIQMPGASGLELAEALARHPHTPPVVFVTAHDEHAVEAFDLRAVDYVLKPVRAERLAEAVRRVVAVRGGSGHRERSTDAEPTRVAVERGGVTRLLDRADITHAEAQGDYVRLHTAEGSHLLRTPLTALEEEWRDGGFVRVHRSLLVALGHVVELRMDDGRCSVVVGAGPAATELQVSRRHTRALREVLARHTSTR